MASNPAAYSNLWNAINNYADLNLFEAYLDERGAPGNLSTLGQWATNINAQAPGLINKTLFALLSYQGSFPGDTSSSVGFWGFLDAQIHAIANHPIASRMPGVGSYTYTLGLTTDYMGRAMDHYYLQGNTDHFGDGDMTQDVSNSQFENSTAGWNLAMGTGGSIGIFNYGTEGISTSHDQFNRTSHGNYGLKTIRGSGANEVSYAATVEAGLTYNVSAYVHAGPSSNLDDAKLKITTSSGQLIAELLGSEMREPVGVLDSWRGITFNFAVNPGQENIRIVLTDEAADLGDIFYWDFVQMEDGFFSGPAWGNWAVDADGNWSDPANWAPGRAPAAVGSEATLGDVITSQRAVNLDTQVNVAELTLDSPYGYTVQDLAGFNQLTLENEDGAASVHVVQGSHEVNAAVAAIGAVNVDVSVTGSLSFGRLIPLQLDGQGLTKTGLGPLHLKSVSGGGNVIVQEGQLFFSGTHVGGGFYAVQAGAVFVAEGLILGDVFNSGIMLLGPTSGGSGLAILGDYSLNSGGILQLEFSGQEAGMYDVLSVGGTLFADGTLKVLLSSGFAPEAGDSFNVLLFGSVSGAFASVDLPTLPASLAWESSRLLATGVLEVIATVLLGDANNDGLVSGSDLITIQQQFGSTGVADPPTGRLLGDANDDGLVTGSDLIAVQEKFGSILAQGPLPAPEPASLAVLGLGAAMGIRRTQAER